MTELEFLADFILHVDYFVKSKGKFQYHKKYIQQLYSNYFETEQVDYLIELSIEKGFLVKTVKREMFDFKLITAIYLEVAGSVDMDHIKKQAPQTTIQITNDIKKKVMKDPNEIIIKSRLLKFQKDIKELEELERFELCQSMLTELEKFIKVNSKLYPNISEWNNKIRQTLTFEK